MATNDDNYSALDRAPLGRAKSVGYFRSSKRNSLIPKSQSPLHSNIDLSSPDVQLNAPLHSNPSSDSINISRNNSVSSHCGSPPGLFESTYLDSNAIPGNLHVSSSKSIEHLMKRYGAVTLIRQLSTDLAQRDAELSLLRRKNSLRENTLVRLLNETGLSTAEVDSLLRERLRSAASQDDDFQLGSLMQDALSENLDNYPYNNNNNNNNNHDSELITKSMESFTLTPTSTIDTTKINDRGNFNDDQYKTVTPSQCRRPHSASLPPDPRSVSSSTNNHHPNHNIHHSSPQFPSSIPSSESETSLLNVVSNKFLTHIPQNLQVALTGTSYANPRSPSTRTPVPVEMENLSTNPNPITNNNENNGYVNQFGFIYDKTKSTYKSTRSSSGRPTSVSLDKSFTAKLLSIANDYDNNQKQGLKQWDEFLKKLTMLNTNPYTENTDLLTINGESITNHKGLNKEFQKIIISNGIPMKYRPKIWYELLNVKYITTPGEYYKLLHNSAPNKENEKQIELDIYRTMPFNVYFKDNGPGLTKLQNILIAFARKFPEIGYCQGMNFIVGNLLIVYSNEEEEAFWAFVGLVAEKLPSGFFQLGTLRCDLDKLKGIFERNLSKLWKHFARLGVELELICFNWFISLFSESLPIEIVLKIWDLIMLNGYIELFKASVALFKVFETQLLGLGSCMDVYEFMKNLNQINVNLKGSELIRFSSNVLASEKDLV